MEFKAEMNKGFARPNLFKVAIHGNTGVGPSKQRKYQMSCFQAQIPGHNLATTDKDIGFRSIAYQKIFSDVILGFYVDADLSQLKYWQEWIDGIINKTTNHHRYYDDYVGTVEITQINRKGDDVATWTLHDAYPKQVDPIQLDYGTNDAVMTCNATITYRHFTVVYKTLVKVDKDRPEEKQYTENTDSDMNQTNIMSTIEKQPALLRITQEEFDEMYPAFDRMNKADQNAVLYLYGANNPQGDSESGGALHMVNTQ
jgi:hypothetical protein